MARAIRISTTTLESYRRLLRTDYGNEDELIATVIGKPWAESKKQAAGKAWHMVVEKIDNLNYIAEHCRMLGLHDPTGAMSGEVVEWCGYAFWRGVADQARNDFGPGLWEVKATKIVQSDMGPVTLVAKADHVNGLMVTDNKATFGSIDLSNYECSLQWQIYLMVHNAKVFRYKVYQFSDPGDTDHPSMEGIKLCELKNQNTFHFWEYVGMNDNIMEWLNEFLFWAKKRNILHYLNREVEE